MLCESSVGDLKYTNVSQTFMLLNEIRRRFNVGYYVDIRFIKKKKMIIDKVRRCRVMLFWSVG